MRRIASAALLVPGLALLAAVACGDSTGPDADNPVAIVHAAPGYDAVIAELDGQVVGVLAAGEAARVSVTAGDHKVVLAGSAGTLTLAESVARGTALGVVLMDSVAPTVHAYHNHAFGGTARIAVINAVPGTALTFSMVGPGAEPATDSLAYTGSVQFGLPHGTYTVTARSGPAGTPVDLGAVEIPFGRHFVVFFPDPEGPDPWSVTVF